MAWLGGLRGSSRVKGLINRKQRSGKITTAPGASVHTRVSNTKVQNCAKLCKVCTGGCTVFTAATPRQQRVHIERNQWRLPGGDGRVINAKQESEKTTTVGAKSQCSLSKYHRNEWNTTWNLWILATWRWGGSNSWSLSYDQKRNVNVFTVYYHKLHSDPDDPRFKVKPWSSEKELQLVKVRT